MSAWAEYLIGSMSSSQARATVAEEMADDPDWRQRLLSLVLVNGAGLDVHEEIATQLSTDPEPSVRAFAEAALDLVAVAAKLPPPATAPAQATQP